MYATESQNYEVNESIRIKWLKDIRSFKLIISEKPTLLVFEKDKIKDVKRVKNISSKMLSGENTPIQGGGGERRGKLCLCIEP